MGNVLIVGLMFLALSIIVIGLFVMIKGGKVSQKYSNLLMRWRVYLQALAIIMLFLLFASKD